MVNPTPPPPAVNPTMTSHQEIKERAPVVTPETAHPVGAPQESNRSKKLRENKEKEKEGQKKNTPSHFKKDDNKQLDIMV